jgi:serine/threonine protein kinase
MTDPDVRKSYEILEKIGKGAYGKVYKARAKKSGMIVAIKKIKFSKDDEGIPAPVLRGMHQVWTNASCLPRGFYTPRNEARTHCQVAGSNLVRQ